MTEEKINLWRNYIMSLENTRVHIELEEIETEIKGLNEMAESARLGYAEYGPTQEECENRIEDLEKYKKIILECQEEKEKQKIYILQLTSKNNVHSSLAYRNITKKKAFSITFDRVSEILKKPENIVVVMLFEDDQTIAEMRIQ